MKEFIEKFKEALDIEGDFDLGLILDELEEWDSMGYISVMAMADEEFGKSIEANQLRECESLGDLYRIVVAL